MYSVSDFRHVFVYVNEERHIVALESEIPLRMSNPWPVVKVWYHRTRGILNGDDFRAMADGFMFGEMLNPDYEEVTLHLVKVAIPKDAPASYAASWAFANLDKLSPK